MIEPSAVCTRNSNSNQLTDDRPAAEALDAAEAPPSNSRPNTGRKKRPLSLLGDGGDTLTEMTEGNGTILEEDEDEEVEESNGGGNGSVGEGPTPQRPRRDGRRGGEQGGSSL